MLGTPLQYRIVAIAQVTDGSHAGGQGHPKGLLDDPVTVVVGEDGQPIKGAGPRVGQEMHVCVNKSGQDNRGGTVEDATPWRNVRCRRLDADDPAVVDEDHACAGRDLATIEDLFHPDRQHVESSRSVSVSVAGLWMPRSGRYRPVRVLRAGPPAGRGRVGTRLRRG